eukprot:SAG31_NODE_2528_length_5557_cov_10.897948_3_plen_80_part_00
MLGAWKAHHNGVRSYPHEIIFKIYHGLPNVLLSLPSRHQHGTGTGTLTRVEVLNLVSVPIKFSTTAVAMRQLYELTSYM